MRSGTHFSQQTCFFLTQFAACPVVVARVTRGARVMATVFLFLLLLFARALVARISMALVVRVIVVLTV